MTQETTEKRRVRDDEVTRIPWKEFIRSQFRKITGFILLLVILAIIINLSSAINSDPDNINPDNIVTLSTQNHIYLIILSSVLFFTVLLVFTKVVLLDHKDEFGISSWRQPRVIGTFFLTTSFISLVYILLDVSLINIYLMTLPTYILWQLQFMLPGLDMFFLDSVDRLAYSNIRGYIFIALLLFLFIFPIVMFLNILTRYGRRTIKERREKEKKLSPLKLIFGLIISLALAAGSLFVFNQISNEVISALALFASLGFLLAAAIFLLLIIFTILRFGFFFTYSNVLLIFPFIFLFYIVPGGLWGIWDLIVIVTTSGVDNTIYANGISSGVTIDPTTTDMSKLSLLQYFEFYLQTVLLNLRPSALLRIIQLDFIIIIGLSAIVIGFAEGYSILAIFRSISQGVSIAKTGRIANRSAPKIIVITSRLFYLAAWLSFFWDNLVVLSQAIVATLNISLPTVELPQILSFIVDLDFTSISSYLIVLTILAVPFYFILTSSFKFLSVSLVLEKVRDDKQYYYLLISSAYILIVTNIFADIAALPEFLGDQRQFLPLAGAATERALPFVAKIFEILEAVGFYAGLIFVILNTIRKRFTDQEKEDEIEEISFVTKVETPSEPPKLDVIVMDDREKNQNSDQSDNSVDESENN